MKGFNMTEEYACKTSTSKVLYERARKVLPAGVSYSIRYFEPYPFYTARARGSKLYDVDGNEYVDFWLGHTALILGHCHPAIVKAVKEQIEVGTHYGTSHELEIELAEQVAKMIPQVEMIRFTNSGTEANMYATRLARAYTRRRKVAKFEGGWHGGYDALHKGVKYPFDMPESAGLTRGALEDTVLLPFNDLEGVMGRLKNEEVGAVIIEPILGAGGGIPAEREFLKGLREHCEEREILLIFDEVITGFRVAPGCSPQYFGVKPDMIVLGKILGGGLPVGAFCGSKQIMERLDSLIHKRPEYSFHGGTFTGNPLTAAAGLATLKILEDGQLINGLNKIGEKIRQQLREIFERKNLAVQVTGESSLFNIHFTEESVKDACAVYRADREKLVNYALHLITKGVFVLPTHTGALSIAHSKEDIEKFLSETEEYAKQIKAA
jgi:glutamate-1-semialdehyde 2,1-aminomutase